MPTARERILMAGERDWVKLLQVHRYVAFEDLDAPLAEVQRKTLELVRSMAAEGELALGELRDHGARFVEWDIPLDDAIDRLAAEYIDRFDDRDGWPWTLWLKVTEKGLALTKEFEEESIAWVAERRRQGREFEAIPARLAPGGPHDS